MDSQGAPVEKDGPSPSSHDAPPSPRRRVSIDEDLFYQHIMTTPPPRPLRPPPYETARQSNVTRGNGKTAAGSRGGAGSKCTIIDEADILPGYTSSVTIEGVFSKKHEIENTVKRAEDRRWHNAFVTLHGTALNIYTTKKDRSWGRTRDGPTISPDNPPWMKKGKLEKTYSLLHADAGIAADYQK